MNICSWMLQAQQQTHPLSQKEKFTQNLTCCHTCCDDGPFFPVSYEKSPHYVVSNDKQRALVTVTE